MRQSTVTISSSEFIRFELILTNLLEKIWWRGDDRNPLTNKKIRTIRFQLVWPAWNFLITFPENAEQDVKFIGEEGKDIIHRVALVEIIEGYKLEEVGQLLALRLGQAFAPYGYMIHSPEPIFHKNPRNTEMYNKSWTWHYVRNH